MGRVSLDAEAAGVAVGLARTHVELPAVPGTADDLAELGIFDLAVIFRLRKPNQRPLAQGSALMRATVQEAEEFAIDVEDRDRAAIDLEEFSRARRQFVHRGNDVAGHVIFA